MELKTFIIFLFIPFSLFAQVPPSKHALLVGLSRFQDNKWDKLHGKEDVENIAEVLKDKGFSANHITLCTDENATQSGIISELEKLAGRIEAGDMVYIHFSTHGQQLEDDNINPREEADGMDECLVPYDCPKIEGYSANYKGEKHLRDDLIGTLLDKIREKAGPNGQVLTVIDACFSGTATRGADSSHMNQAIWFGKSRPVGNAPESSNSITGNSSMAPGKIAPMVAIFAALPGEQSRDLMLSAAVSKTFENSGPYTTYSMFFKSVVSEVKLQTNTLTPNAEGLEKMGDHVLFGGTMADPIAYFLVKDVASDFQLTLEQGYFANLYPNTTLAFYPEGTRISELSSDNLLATGKILRSTEFTATVNIQKSAGVSDGDLQKSWVYVTNWVISDQLLPVQMDIQNTSLKNALEQHLSQNQNFKIQNGIQKSVLIKENKDKLSIFDQEGLLLHEIGTSSVQSKYISEDIERFLLQYQRFVTIRNLHYKSEDIKVEWNVYPAKCMSSCDALPGKILFDTTTDLYEMKPGECFGVEIKNNSSKEVFFSLIDFRAKQFEPNEDMVLIPVSEATPESFSIKPGKTWKSSDFAQGYCWQIEPIYGKETLKLITSRLPVPLREAVKTRSVTDKQEQMAGDNLFEVQDIHILVKEK